MDVNDVKAGIRALLSSTTFSYNLKSLLYDFKITFGYDLPFFGYNNPVAFLQSLGDTVQLYGNPYNPEICLVESRKSSHITSLVDRQKNYPRQKLPYRAYAPRRIILPCKNPDPYIPSNGGKSYGHSTQKARDTGQPPEVRPKHEPQSRQEAKDTRPPPEVHTNQEQSKQESRILNPQAEINQIQSSDINNKVKSCSLPLFEETVSVGKTVSPSHHKVQEKLKNSQPEKTDCFFEDVLDNKSCCSPDKDCSKKSNSCQTFISLGYVNDGMQKKLKNLIKNFPDGLWCCDLPNLFKEAYSLELDYREFGYTSLIQMLSDLPDVVKCVRPGQGDWILFDSNVIPSHLDNVLMKLELNEKSLIEVKSNLKKLLISSEVCSHGGIEIDQIADRYEKMFESPLDYKSYGFTDFRSLLDTLEGTFISISTINDKTIVVPKIRSTSHSPIKWEEALPPITPENDIFFDIFPSDVIGPGESLPELDLSRHFSVGQMVEVCIAEVWSPYRFFIQLNKYKDSLSTFMDDLQKFYNVYLNKYKMPDATIRPNQFCVGLYNSDPEYPEEWNRARIIKVVNEKIVTVRLVDYGTVVRMKKTQIRFLHRNFQALPIQAFQAKLIGVSTLNGEEEWPLPVNKKFLEFLQVPYVEAEMVEVDFKKKLVGVILYDKFQTPVLNINKKLVSDHLAKYEGTILEERARELEKMNQMQKNFSRSSRMQNKNLNNKIFDTTDEFLEISDLENKSYTPLLHCKTNSAKSEVAEKEANVCFEFDKVVDLKKSENCEVVTEEKETKKKTELFEINEEFEVSTASKPTKKINTASKQEVPVIKSNNTKKSSSKKDSCTSAKETDNSAFLKQPRRLPPGFEGNVSFPDTPLLALEQPDDIEKKINLLAVELLSSNMSIKEVALTNPELALRIATQMASAYLNLLYSDTTPINPMLSSLLTVVPPNGVLPSAVSPNGFLTPDVSSKGLLSPGISSSSLFPPGIPVNGMLPPGALATGLPLPPFSSNSLLVPSVAPKNTLATANGFSASASNNFIPSAASSEGFLKLTDFSKVSCAPTGPSKDSVPPVDSPKKSIPSTNPPEGFLKPTDFSKESFPPTSPSKDSVPPVDSPKKSISSTNPPEGFLKPTDFSKESFPPTSPFKDSIPPVDSPKKSIPLTNPPEGCLKPTDFPKVSCAPTGPSKNSIPTVDSPKKSVPSADPPNSVLLQVDQPKNLLPPTVPSNDSCSTTSTNRNDDIIHIHESKTADTPVVINKNCKFNEFIEKRLVGDKILHVVKVDGKPYFLVEELIHFLTIFTSLEICDRVLVYKRAHFQYKILTKKKDEEVVKAIKSLSIFEILRKKKKKKKLEVYLLPLHQTLPYLEVLGCHTGQYFNDLTDLIKTYEEPESAKPKSSKVKK